MIINQIVSGGGNKIETATVSLTSSGGPIYRSVAYTALENNKLVAKQFVPSSTSFTISDVVIGTVLSVLGISILSATITGGTKLFIHDMNGGSFHASVDAATVTITIKGEK